MLNLFEIKKGLLLCSMALTNPEGNWKFNPPMHLVSKVLSGSYSTKNHHAYTYIHHQIQLAVGDMTMSGWKPTISLIHPPTHL